MKRSNKVVFFIVAILIFAFAYMSFFGISNYYGDTKNTYIKGAQDIRWGIDIRGGVEAIFTPDVDEETFAAITEEDMLSAETVINNRLATKHITDSEVYTDIENKQIIVRFPWQSEETDYDPNAAVKELGETAVVIFREGSSASGTVILQGSAHVERADAVYDSQTNAPVVQLTLTSEGASLFASATSRLVGQVISIWLDDTLLSAPNVNEAIPNGRAIISGMESADAASELADKINAGSLPFALKVDDTIQVINPTLGEQALNVMLIAALIAFAIIVIMVVAIYRLPGFIAAIALLGQVAGMIACTSGFFTAFDSFTMTIPGIAGMILSIGMGVDANVITSERIKEEIRAGRTLDGAIDAGYDNAFSAILDGNVTTMIIAVILMGVFGPTGGLWARILTPFMWLYNHSIGLIPGLGIANSITGSVYAFGYTLLIGVIFNFIMGVFASRLMLKGVSRFKFLRNPRLYGGRKVEKERRRFDFIGKRRVFACIAGCLILVGVIFNVIFGTQLHISFKGGTIFTYSYSGQIDTDAVKATAAEALGKDVTVSLSSDLTGGSKQVTVSLADKETVSTELQADLTKALTETFSENEIESLEANSVKPSVGSGFFIKCLFAVLLGALFVTIYVGIRFRRIGGLSAGVFAALALLHDVLISYFIYVIFRIPLDSNFIAVVLTLVGYSLNGTIVIYDRIRENEKLYGRTTGLNEIVNLSVNQTAMRNVITSITTFLAVLALCAVALISGLRSILSFAFPMAVGVVAGCYSSVLLSSPLWALWREKKAARLAAKKQAAKKVNGRR